MKVVLMLFFFNCHEKKVSYRSLAMLPVFQTLPDMGTTCFLSTLLVKYNCLVRRKFKV